MTDIPDRERGYSIEASTAVVHERYQDHAPRAMRTSALGVTNVLKGREAVACLTCFPEPKASKRKVGGDIDINVQGLIRARDPFEIAAMVKQVKPESESGSE